MNRVELKAEARTINGKQVKKLRREGITPANIYGKGFESVSIQLPIKDFEAIYNKVHETGLVDLTVGKETYPVLIHNVQRHPISHDAIHVDFYKVNLKEKVKTSIPVIGIGEAEAEKQKVGALMQSLNEVEVEALPTELPENIEVSVEHLAAIDDHILVSDLKVPTGVVILTEPEGTVFRITELVSQEAEELEAEEEAAAAEAAEEAAGEEGAEAKGEGEKVEGEEAGAEPKEESSEAKE